MPVTISWLATETEILAMGGDVSDTTFETLILDGTASETYETEAAATEHPVEEGADITDHVKPALRRVTLEVLVSAHPGPSSHANAALEDWDAPAERPRLVRRTIDRLIAEGIEVDIDTPTRSFDSMLLLSAIEDLNADRGDCYRAMVSAREFRRVATSEVTAPSPRVERGRRTANRGRQSGGSTTLTETPVERSTALELLQSLNPTDWGGR